MNRKLYKLKEHYYKVKENRYFCYRAKSNDTSISLEVFRSKKVFITVLEFNKIFIIISIHVKGVFRETGTRVSE